MLGISWVAEELLVSVERFSSIELVVYVLEVNVCFFHFRWVNHACPSPAGSPVKAVSQQVRLTKYTPRIQENLPILGSETDYLMTCVFKPLIACGFIGPTKYLLFCLYISIVTVLHDIMSVYAPVAGSSNSDSRGCPNSSLPVVSCRNFHEACLFRRASWNSYFIFFIISPLSLFWKNKSRLMRSRCCLCLCVSVYPPPH
jgi:hypothetical protein